MTRWLRLLGRDFEELGPLGTAGFPEGGGAAISRGLYPKAYRHTDPNEDGALLYLGDDAALIAVVDGYNGRAGAEAALDVLCARGDVLLAARGEDFPTAVEAVVRTAQQAIAHVDPARTCLALATLRSSECYWANFGDSSVFRASQAEPVHGENDIVLGNPLGPWPHGSMPWWGTFTREPGERVFAVTDGVTNFAADPRGSSALVREAASDREAAQAVTLDAMKGGAGDNVAAVVLGPYPPAEDEESTP